MRSFLLTVMPVMLWVFTCFHVCFIVACARGYKKSKNIMYLLTLLVTVGLFYDALILSSGTFLGDGALLKGLSRMRFVSHGGLIPLLFPICLYGLKVQNKTVKTVVWAFTGVVIVAGLAEAFATVLDMKEINNVVRYAAGPATPVWAEKISRVLSFGTVIPLMIVGVIVWIKQKRPELFFSGFLMFAFSALGPATGNSDLIFFISMAGEVLMVLFLFLYARKASN